MQLSSDTTVLVAAAERGMRKICQPGYRLAKAGVMLLKLSPQTREQPSLLPREKLWRTKHSELCKFANIICGVCSKVLPISTVFWPLRDVATPPVHKLTPEFEKPCCFLLKVFSQLKFFDSSENRLFHSISSTEQRI